MSYTVLARRYRSQDFDEVIGQEAIAQTLKKAIETDRVAHAYLFTGTRGVGKTSMARIFARALNVTPELEDAEAISKAIMRGDDIDVLEIDGASNRGVEEARDLIANCIYRPTRSPYKIYIIDEVHMLTKEAFNTLLKTMEEPPEHVKFILCTTEPHKVLPTIQSRCQRYDFRAIPTARIADHLKNVLKREKIKADERAIFEIARMGNGSMRDALSLLDRLLSEGLAKITPESLTQALGLPDHSLVDALIGAIAEGDAANALKRTDDLLSKGSSIDQMLELLIERFRVLMHVALCGKNSELIDLADDERDLAAEQVRSFDAESLIFMIALLENAQRSAKSSNSARALVDAAIVRLALSERFAQATALLENGPVGPGNAQKKTSERAGGGDSTPPLTATLPKAAPKPVDRNTNAAPASDGGSKEESHEPVADPSAAIASALHENLRLSPFAGALKWDWPPEGPSFRIRLTDASQAPYAKTQVSTIETVIKSIVPTIGSVSLVVEDASAGGDDGSSRAGRSGSNSKDLAEVMSIPIVQKAIDLLDARIVSVRDASEQS